MKGLLILVLSAGAGFMMSRIILKNYTTSDIIIYCMFTISFIGLFPVEIIYKIFFVLLGLYLGYEYHLEYFYKKNEFDITFIRYNEATADHSFEALSKFKKKKIFSDL